MIGDSVAHVQRGLDGRGPVAKIPLFVIDRVYATAVEAGALAPAPAAERRLDVSLTDSTFAFYLAQQLGPRATFGAAVGLVALFGAFGAAAAFRLRRERLRRRALHESRRQLAEGREDERLHLARELHDGAVQDLHALRMGLSLRDLGGDGGGGDGGPDVQAELLRVINELRALAEDLRPPSLGPFGLAAALRSLTDRARRQHPDLDVSLDADDDGQRLPEHLRLVLFRICQEALSNAARHAHARHVRVRFALGPDAVALDVDDDGVGFSPPDDYLGLARGGHYGLLGITERADAIGARLRIASAPGQGTRLRLTAPLPGLHAPTPRAHARPEPAPAP